jgi:hypothetical protein
MNELLAISFLQPWLWAIIEGHKPVENRSWKPPRNIVGQVIALHASRGWDSDGRVMIEKLLGEAAAHSCMVAPRGAIVGTARVAGAFQPGGRAELVGPILDADVDRLAASPWALGPWVWLLTDVRKFAEPIPCKGALGCWRVPAAVDVGAHMIRAPGRALG